MNASDFPNDGDLNKEDAGKDARSLRQAIEDSYSTVHPESSGIDLDATSDFQSNLPLSFLERMPRVRHSGKIGGYQLMRLLGSGGMGHAFEAEGPSGERVAIKLIWPELATSKEAIERFQMEGKIASTINHPRCVFVKAADTDGGIPYIVMELMPGYTLRDLVSGSEGLAVSDAIEKILDVIDGLQEIHSRGLIHRDIKPANCFLEQNGRVKVGDFGLAKSLTQDVAMTQTGGFVGTPLYASPEQIRGDALDARSDVYSVSATLYYLLVGRAPFENSTPMQLAAKIVSEDPPALRSHKADLPPQLEEILLKGLCRDRDRRFRSLEELRHALTPFLSHDLSVIRVERRLVAFLVDYLASFLLTFCIFVLPRLDNPSNESDWKYSLLNACWLSMYFFFAEGFCGTSLGKRLVDLRVVHEDSKRSAAWWQYLTRAVLFFLTFGGLVDLVSLFFDSPSNEYWREVGTILMAFVSLLPVFFTKKRQMLHEILSCTVVVDRLSKDSLARMNDTAIDWSASLQKAEGFPEQIGPFVIHGMLASSGENTLLSALDTRLSRATWLLLRPLNCPPISNERRNCDQTSRIRWMSSGREADWQWDAFVAPLGAPLSTWYKSYGPFPWSFVRKSLEQLLEEQQSSQKWNTLVDVKSIEQVWLNTNGRIVLIDFPWLAGANSIGPNYIQNNDLEGTTNERPSELATSIYLMREVSRQMLTGVSYPIADKPCEVPAILPRSARRFLDRIDGRSQPFQSTEDLVASLNSTRTSPDEVTLRARLAGMLVAVFTLGVLYFLTMIITGSTHTVTISNLGNSFASNLGLAWLADHPETLEQVVSANPELRGNWTSDYLRDLAEKNHQSILTIFKNKNRYNLGFDRSIMDLLTFDLGAEEQMDSSRVELVDGTAGSDLELMVRSQNSEKPKSSVRLDQLKELAENGVIAQHYHMVILRFYAFLVSALFLPVILWSGIMYGGIPFLVCGIHVVRSSGAVAPWWLRLARSFLIWIPIWLLLMLVVWLDLFHSNLILLNWTMIRVCLFSPFIYGLVACLTPARTPQDRLLGTYLVPR